MFKILHSLCSCSLNLSVYKHLLLFWIRYGQCPSITCRLVCVGVNSHTDYTTVLMLEIQLNLAFIFNKTAYADAVHKLTNSFFTFISLTVSWYTRTCTFI